MEKLCVDKIQTTINHSTPTEGEWRGSEKAIDSSNMAEQNLFDGMRIEEISLYHPNLTQKNYKN